MKVTSDGTITASFLVRREKKLKEMFCEGCHSQFVSDPGGRLVADDSSCLISFFNI